MTVLALLATQFLHPDGDEAREWAIEELSKDRYRQTGTSLLDRIGMWIAEQLEKFNFNVDVGTTSLGSITVILVTILVVGFVIFYGRLRPGSKKQKFGPVQILDDTRELPALLKDARAAHQAGHYAAACADYYRACIRVLDREGVIIATPGMTAREAADQGNATTGLPLHPAAAIFDSVVYGGGSASAEDAAMVSWLYEQCSSKLVRA